ncbi:Swt1 family HEPN domain-containing protein [Rhodopseudomonas pseudopalustris]|uniref:Predicted ATPase, AAA+ superfamily n=1 Tax=Rhodopseudomonas pseudopalustris TaxID=1513892 RepID=A0A1H8SQ28_9BRAD|nr:Swt1 family HEPN domain-containing protein [Rhodopseudomonas pseudopalustris]SEO80438.1 Predicted ATPase, AAA+ superfamily [Rhodopseudomonas pseudopalustris]
MAVTNQERVGKALDLLKAGLRPFVEREMNSKFGAKWPSEAQDILRDTRLGTSKGDVLQDVSVQLVIMDRKWADVFRNTLGKAERSLINELIDIRNRWAHQQPFTSDDADRALDSMARLLTAISAPEADEIGKMKMELRRLIFDEQMRSERRKGAGTAIESQVTGSLKPWREVVNPHKDVASGRYQQAEFAADLWQVHIGEGSDEYRNPVEFFRRTYLTHSLKELLAGAMRRLTGNGGDPVVQLQTNFGGGKTHSMLALYHLFSGTKPGDLAGIDPVLADAGIGKLPEHVKRVVLVGNKISPGNPSVKADGTIVKTLWGELAWQLGGKPAFDKVRADDERATSPGDTLRELMNAYGPCLILIDEWVAYARQLHDDSDLPAGSFETHFSFAQALTESAKLANHCLLVISLPSSDTAISPHAQGDDEEVGGARGRAALARLRNVIGRVESSWAPASTEEGFEIVRRRLFEPLIEKVQFVARDSIARSFFDLYRTQHQEFPPECRDSDYENRLKAAYPIHPEVFDRLYTDWSTLVKFQRTRGVLRLMAAVIHSLWEKGDRNPLIMPSNIPIDDPRVRDELTRYLPDQWKPIIEKDVDGPNALPLRIDGEVPNLGKFAACRRVARTIYLGSAPTSKAANRGVEDRRIKLGCVMPGESPAVFGDALRRLSSSATFLYQDGARYWYSTQPTVTKLAEDRAEQLKRNTDPVVAAIEERLRTDLRVTGDFRRIHPVPHSGADVPDDMEARLVVLGIDHPYSKDAANKAQAAAIEILQQRGSGPRIFQNSLVFLAIDQTRLQDLDESVRRYLAWSSVLDEKDGLNLDPHQVKQAETQLKAADGAVVARLPEAYQWLLVPVQRTPQDPLQWQTFRLTGQDGLAVRASKKLRSEELFVPSLAGTRLRMELDRVPLWRGNHVPVKQLAEDFTRYVYLPRLRDPAVLTSAIQDGLGLLLWYQESFAYADGFDEATGRYRGLRCGQRVDVFHDTGDGLIVRADVALKQQEADVASARPPTSTGVGAAGALNKDREADPGVQTTGAGISPTMPLKPQRYFGTVALDASRVGRDAGRIAEEVIAHLSGLVGSEVTVTLEIEARVQGGVPDNVVRTVTENSRTLKFKNHGFESE